MTYRLDTTIAMLPPTVNHLYKSIGGARKALTDEAHTFRDLLAIEPRHAPKPPAGELKITAWFTFGSRRRADIDNRIKWLSDSLATILGFDDSRIHEWHIYRVDGPRDGCRVRVEVI